MSLQTQQLGLQTSIFIVCTNHCGLQVQYAQHRPRVYLRKSSTDPIDSLNSLCALHLAANQVYNRAASFGNSQHTWGEGCAAVPMMQYRLC